MIATDIIVGLFVFFALFVAFKKIDKRSQAIIFFLLTLACAVFYAATRK